MLVAPWCPSYRYSVVGNSRQGPLGHSTFKKVETQFLQFPGENCCCFDEPSSRVHCKSVTTTAFAGERQSLDLLLSPLSQPPRVCTSAG
jgi:hypothetical protein